MDGVLIIDKPAGITSHDVVARCRRILQMKRVGHTGTLDPFATGVVVILLGKATRLAQFLDKDAKEYEATIRFGFETTTGDLTGASKGIQNSKFKIQNGEIEEALKQFRGPILQTPPMFSAKKVEGKKLYELARKGIEIERKPAAVTVFELEFSGVESRESELPAVAGGLFATLNTSNPAEPADAVNTLCIDENNDQIRIRVRCSAGTYIRTLAEDIGRVLGIGAHLTALRRSKAGKFSLKEAVTLEGLEEITREKTIDGRLVPMSEALSHLPSIELTDLDLAAVTHGMKIKAPSDGSDLFRLVDSDGSLAAVGSRVCEDFIQPKIVLV
jgi:tRNA pseudouridine55 synthase